MKTPLFRGAAFALSVALVAALFVLVKGFDAFARERRFVNSIGMEFVLVPAGTFIMGSPMSEADRDNDEDPYEVTITKPFYMQTTEVTLGQWREVMGKRLFGRRRGAPDQPVVNVSWFDCRDFISKLNKGGEGTYRLPTEAEWEYACRAGTTTAYFWGNEPDCSKAMYGNNPVKSEECIQTVESMGLEPGKPAPVKSYEPNPWGIFDMHGNVWEWCEDWYGAYPEAGVKDPMGPGDGNRRVRRSGSWYKYGWYCRSANRNMAHPAVKLDTLGFRLVREVE
ncbi:MAG: formylglycine-generating enzyme family protein [Thermodesulfobacteriota bacterium]